MQLLSLLLLLSLPAPVLSLLLLPMYYYTTYTDDMIDSDDIDTDEIQSIHNHIIDSYQYQIHTIGLHEIVFFCNFHLCCTEQSIKHFINNMHV